MSLFYLPRLIYTPALGTAVARDNQELYDGTTLILSEMVSREYSNLYSI